MVVETIDVESSSGAKANVALIQNLNKVGLQVRVFHYSRREIEIKGIHCVALKEDRKSLLFYLSRTERKLRLIFKLSLNHYVEKIFGFSFTHLNDRNSIIKGLKSVEFAPDLILTLSQGGSFRPHNALLEIPKWHDRWIAYVHDPYPMASFPRPYDWVEPGHQKKRNFFLKVAEKAKYAAYPSELLAEWMESYYHPLKLKRLIIPHQLVQEADDPTIKLPGFFNIEKFSILHAGTLLDARNPWGLVKGFERFLKRVPEAASQSQLIFIGGESRFGRELLGYEKSLKQLKISETSLPYKVVLTLQRIASVNVILEAKGPISPFLPGKFPHCIAAGKPILLLGPFYSESRRLLGKNYSFWSEINDEERICDHLIYLYDNWKKGVNPVYYFRLKRYLSEFHLKEILESLV